MTVWEFVKFSTVPIRADRVGLGINLPLGTTLGDLSLPVSGEVLLKYFTDHLHEPGSMLNGACAAC
jgi:hypothetical protein